MPHGMTRSLRRLAVGRALCDHQLSYYHWCPPQTSSQMGDERRMLRGRKEDFASWAIWPGSCPAQEIPMASPWANWCSMGGSQASFLTPQFGFPPGVGLHDTRDPILFSDYTCFSISGQMTCLLAYGRWERWIYILETMPSSFIFNVVT